MTVIERLTSPWGLLALGIGATLAVRWFIAAPYLWIGDDMGTYLSTMNYVLGADNTGFGHHRPPLVGYYLIPFVSAFGPLTGGKIAALVASVAGAVPFFLLVRRFVPPYFASVGSLIYMWWVFADTLAFGFLTLLALAAVLLGCWAFLRFAEHPTLDRAVTAAALIAIVPNLNQTAIIPYLGLLTLYGGFLIARNARKYAVGLSVMGVVSFVLALPSLPYINNTRDVYTTGGATLEWENFVLHTVDIWGERSIFLVLRDPASLIMAALIIPVFIWAGRKVGGVNGGFIACAGIVALTLQALTVPTSMGLMTVLGRNVSWMWTWMLVVGLCGAAGLARKQWLASNPATAPVVGCLAAGVILALGISWATQFRVQEPSYLNADYLHALEWLDEHTEEHEVIATHPFTISFAVNGLINRPTIATTPSNEGAVSQPCWNGWIASCSFSKEEPDWGKALTHYQRDEDEAIRCAIGLKHRIQDCARDIGDYGAKYILTPTYWPAQAQAVVLRTPTLYIYEIAPNSP